VQVGSGFAMSGY